MKKSEIVKSISESTSLTHNQVSDVVSALIRLAHEELEAKQEFTLHNLVNLKVTTRAARKGRNPQTGQPMDIPACLVVKAKPHGAMKIA